MRTLLTIAALLCVGCTSSRQHFYLRSAQTGMLIDGRFTYHDGVYLPPSDWGFLIDRPRPGEIETIERLKSTELKEVDFRQANVTQVVVVANEMQKSQLGRVVVPITVDLDGYRQFVGADHPGNRENATAEDWRLFELRVREVPRFTGSYRHISLFELLRTVSIITWLPMNIDGASVELSQRPFREAASNEASEDTPLCADPQR